MAFGQINYQEKVGNGPYTIAEIGCFVTAFANLLTERFGEPMDPEGLNNFFTQRGVYLSDPGDGAGVKDELAWGSVSSYDPTVHVIATGGEGWPQNSNAIVKFYYKSQRTGQWTTHFCLVNDVASHTIVDSWDGRVKEPGEYGTPVAWAEYAKAAPQPVAPVPVETHPAPAPAGPEYDGNSITVQPGWGLSNAAAAAGYPDAGNPLRWEAIAALNGSNNWQAFNAGLKPGQRIIVGKYTPPVSQPTPPAPAAPSKPANTVYTKLDISNPNMVTNRQPTHVWKLDFVNDAHATADHDLPQDTPVVVYGKAQRTDGDKPCYYMTQEDFGNADTSGVPNNNRGINTVDLSPAPATPAPAAPTQPTTPAASAAPENADTTSPNEGKVEVKVLPPNPNKWMQTFTSFMGPVKYIAKETVVIKEAQGLENADGSLTHPNQELVKGMIVEMGGRFTGPDGNQYMRTAKSVAAGLWYEIPEDAVMREDDITDEELDDLLNDVGSALSDLKNEKVMRKAAEVDGFVSRLFHRKK